MPSFTPPWFLQNGLAMTLYTALVASQSWHQSLDLMPVAYRDHVFRGHGDIPIFGRWAVPDRPQGTIIATYGITGSLQDQWQLEILGRKAYQRGYGLMMFDWRAHGKTGELSPTLTSDGIYEGHDYMALATQAKALGCPPPYWFMGYSLSGQLALWGAKAAMDVPEGLVAGDIGGIVVICPSLDSNRSLRYLTNDPLGKYLERSIAQELKRLAQRLHQAHPTHFDPAAIARANSIWGFDHELVISRLGFASVEDYYAASSPLPFMADLTIPTLILYAADDPLFSPEIIPDLQSICAANPHLDLMLTDYGGHVGYYSGSAGQRQAGDSDPWWSWNRALDWVDRQMS
ncbi:alpha/beta fold hydrolase [Nodosilinea sp. LEGE 07088]|uniref:YheT family hydrolase n=1 Tax=Nodosilinea sp. LEGE 07088 TaxID=2777968 RepID=UPI00187E1511|nr:alpha/beta fold hydrolase [Nodosilinea sp. LEGE 07088]MBE9139304.1 alpha/beta fold hydrolase [Nodosilinea sp. LEGE 07088]